ncbi:CAP domain-containing protein [Staphylococcus arlettae]|uniref:CAP domain-containing protein n=1 Tax=Staphylococcus arlettae TaxID=29378 RepID=UPI00190AB787|nr:CAP domain-containing protein [Staphylococcus arlettae]
MMKIRKILLYSLIFLCIVLIVPIKESPFMLDVQQEVKTKINAWQTNQSSSTKSLKVPSEQQFALSNIQMNMDKADVENKFGEAKSVTSNEYGTSWHTYYTGDYSNFVMVSYLDDKVNALYTNQNSITSQSKIKYGTPKDVVRDRLGEPITEKKKGNVRYQIENDEYDTFHENQIYTTAFYDKHQDNGLTAILLVSDQLEQRLQGQYGAPSEALKEGFERQNFEIVNAERKQHQLSTLNYDSDVSDTARKHSKDMAENDYFDHTNLDDESPFDRLKADDIKFNVAGENLAYGQMNSIYAHEGLMNSLGHRKNILRSSYNELGVGVAFNDERQPYWTENYTN